MSHNIGPGTARVIKKMKALLQEPRGAKPPEEDGKLGVVAAAHCRSSARRRWTTGAPLEDLWLWQRPDLHWKMEIKETCRASAGRLACEGESQTSRGL